MKCRGSSPQSIQCLNCNEITINPKFCSTTCSSQFNNKLRPNYKPSKFCEDCSIEIHHKSKKCRKCAISITTKDWSGITLGQLIDDVKTHNSRDLYGRIRERARKIYAKSDKPKKCICGYIKHYQISHKKGIATFDLQTPISTINDLDNLVALCPNHHWEFDNNKLSKSLLNKLNNVLGEI